MTCWICNGQHFATECPLAETDDFEPDDTVCPGCEKPLAGTGWCASCEDYATDIAAFQAAADERRLQAQVERELSFLMRRDAA